MSNAQSFLVYSSGTIGIICILVFFSLFAQSLFFKPKPAPPEADTAAAVKPHGAIVDTAKLFEALSKLTDSLNRAGPMYASLVGAMFFFRDGGYRLHCAGWSLTLPV